nr:RHS repeat-associated core domain-containing protein [Taylorella equigenitalis]
MGNLLRHISGSHFDYDQRGNLIKKESAKGIQTFDWDGFNQMKSTTFRGARAGSRLDTQYRYDVFGRRIGKRVVDVRTKEVLEQTLYDWDGLTIASEDRIGEQLAVQAQIRKEAGSEKRKLSSEVQYLYEDGEFVPLVQYTNSAAVGLGYGSFGGGSGGAGSLGGGSKGVAPAVYHYVNDQIGTPQILMNADQEVVWEAQSKAWGDTVISAPVSDDGVINNHRFQGQYFDAESELHYNTFRYYDPEIGRFISLDPIGLWGGLNNYQYAPNPVEWVDPWGLENWGLLLTKAIGGPPDDMIRPHAHHIVFKGMYLHRPKLREQLIRSRNILSKYNIDPVHDMRTLMWAPNKGHSLENAKRVADMLEEADKKIQRDGGNPCEKCAQDRMIAELQRIGSEVFPNI